MAEGMTAGDQDQDIRVVGVDIEGEGTEVEEAEETGALRTGSAEESFEGGETTGENFPNCQICVLTWAARNVNWICWLFQIQGSRAWSAWRSRLL